MKKNIVITGANRGIGLALVQQYIANGDAVFAVCRNRSAELDAITQVSVIEGIDTVSTQDLHDLRDSLNGINIDVLINNAGVLSEEILGQIDYQRVEQQFKVNAMGPLRTTEMLIGNLQKGSKVAFISSRMGSISDNGSGGSYGYRMSKAALNAAAASLAIDLKPKGIAVGLLHPGFVQTSLVDFQGNLETSEAAELLEKRIQEISLENTGSFRHSNGENLPW